MDLEDLHFCHTSVTLSSLNFRHKSSKRCSNEGRETGNEPLLVSVVNYLLRQRSSAWTCVYVLCMQEWMDGSMNGCMCIIMNIYILVYVCAHTYNYESMHTHVYTYMHEFAWNCIVV